MAKKSGKRSPTAHRTPEQIREHGRTYQATKKQKANRAARGRARTKMAKKVGKAAIKGKDIGHKKPLAKGGSNRASNLAVVSKRKNRGHGMTRGKKANRGK